MDLSHFPFFNLGFWPTPVHELSALSLYLSGPSIYIKRDDLTGLAFGGNKTRKLEFLIGEAISLCCDTIITGGAEQSNHCRQTAAAAAASGLECHLVLGGKEPDAPNGNLFLDILLGAIIHRSGSLRKGEMIPEIAENLKSAGKKVYEIPYGGSDSIGAMGFVVAASEIAKQSADLSLDFTHIVFPSSSGGTHAGLLVGKELTGQNYQIVGVQIDKELQGGFTLAERILYIAKEVSEIINLDYTPEAESLTLLTDYCNNGYGVVGEAEKEAIRLLASLEGIFLDPVYTGRAMGAMIDLIQKKEFKSSDRILFWHTGGTPTLFANPNTILQ